MNLKNKIITVANQKGGVAKSTSAINIGIGLARQGRRVLIIDNDPQGSCTAALGYQQPDALEVTLATIMERIVNEDDFNLMDGILHNDEGVDLMPANIELAGVETSLMCMPYSESYLKEYVEKIKDNYDYIIIDCSPNLGKLTINALNCATDIIIPVQAAYLPIKGLEQLLKTISIVKRKMNPELNIMGILLTMVDYRTNYAKEITEVLYTAYGNKIPIFETRIPLSVRAAESTAEGVSIFVHDRNGKVARAYENVTEEVICNE